MNVQYPRHQVRLPRHQLQGRPPLNGAARGADAGVVADDVGHHLDLTETAQKKVPESLGKPRKTIGKP